MFKFTNANAVVVTCCAILIMAWGHRAMAEGALALGTSGDIAKDGYSIGITWNYATTERAREQALEWCRTHGSPRTRASCKFVIDIHRQCAAEATDPEPGTPGAGWAIAPDKQSAETMAMANCMATAGQGRGQFCKVANSICDTSDTRQ